MKLFVILSALIVICQATLEQEFELQFDANLKTCKDQEGGTDADMLAVKQRKEDASEKAKCMEFCVFEKFQWMANGKLNLTKVLESVKNIFDEKKPELADQMKEVAIRCDSIINIENCSYAYEILQCWKKQEKAMG